MLDIKQIISNKKKQGNFKAQKGLTTTSKLKTSNRYLQWEMSSLKMPENTIENMCDTFKTGSHTRRIRAPCNAINIR